MRGKRSFPRRIGLMLFAGVAASIISVVISSRLAARPELIIERSYTIADVRAPNGILSVTKFKISNNSLSVIRQLKMELSTDSYIEQPTIIINSLAKHGVDEGAGSATINLSVLPPKEHVVVTVFGISYRPRFEDVLTRVGGESSRNIFELPHDFAELPAVVSIKADVSLSIKTKSVATKNLLDQEAQDGFVAHRFLFLWFSVEGEDYYSFIDIKVAPGDNEAIHSEWLYDGREFSPPFESPLVLFGAKSSASKRVYYLDGPSTIELKPRSDKRGELYALYLDIYLLYQPKYESKIYFSAGDESGSKPVTISANVGAPK